MDLVNVIYCNSLLRTKFYQNWTIFHGALTISEWRPSAILDFRNLQFMSRPSYGKDLLKSDDRLLSYVQKTIFKMGTVCHLEFYFFWLCDL